MTMFNAWFEPNSIVEEQWLPRPLSDYESSLDAIERLEEDRRRRLRSIATVPARTPIGLSGIEDRGHAGSTSTHSPKPSGGSSSNAYNRYRHYPSPEVVDRNRLATTVGQHQQPTLSAAPLPPLLPPDAAVATTRRQYRRTTSASSASTMDTSGVVAETTTTTSRQRQNLTLSMVSTPITSPRIDPRAGGGGYYMSSSVGRRSPVRPTIPPSSSSSSIQDESGNGTNSRQQQSLQILTSGIVASMPPTPQGNEEWITPPAAAAMMMNVDNSFNQTPGVNTGADVYSRRRDASQQRQRRRRRGWEEE
jgi:hypothetical protein